MEDLENIHDIYVKTIQNAGGVPYRLDYRSGKYTYIGNNIADLLDCDFEAAMVTPEYFGSRIIDYEVVEPQTIFPAVNYDKLFVENDIQRYRIDFRIKTEKAKLKWINDCALPLVDDEDGTIYGAIGILQDISDRKCDEEALRKALTEKETLLKEVHHRIKNNLQIIHSLLNLQSHKRPDIDKNIFSDCKNRVRSMALVHERLYGSDDFINIEFGQYLDILVKEIFTELHTELRPDIRFIFNSQSIHFPIEKAIPCGLIVNEAITNSIKYAFPVEYQGKPEVRIDLRQSGRKVDLIIKDNGVGFPKDANLQNIDSLGVYLIRILTKQLGGEYCLESNDGCCWNISFPLK